MPGSVRAGLPRKVLVTLPLAVATWLVAGWLGFPRVFQWYFVGYVLLALPFFVLLDAPAGRLPRRPALAIFAFFVLLSAILTLVGFALPQYEPRAEIEKIRRLQQVAREREEARRLETLKRLTEKRDLSASRTPEAPAPGSAPASPAAPALAVARARVADPGLVERGKQVYQDQECHNCHKIGGKGGVKRRGPELDSLGNLVSAEMLEAKLLDPFVFMTEGYEEEYRKTIMPDDLRDRMGPREIEALVAYLASLRDDKADPPTPRPLFKAPTGWVFVPQEFQRVMPKKWWTDPQVLQRGKLIYEGAVKPDVTCAACHGRDGQPLLTGARDFRAAGYLAKMSDTYWFWRLSEGVLQTPMTPMKEKLTEDERWQVIAYQHTFSHGGRAEEHAH